MTARAPRSRARCSCGPSACRSGRWPASSAGTRCTGTAWRSAWGGAASSAPPSRRAELPEHLLADEHHQTRDGRKNYIATTVAEGCCLGAGLAQTAGAEDLTGGLRRLQGGRPGTSSPSYQPRTVSVDGWASTHQAWLALFPLVVLLRCFLHGWLNIRSRGKLSESFRELSERVWEAYHAPDRRSFAQRLRRLPRVGPAARDVGVAAGAGGEAVRSVEGVRRGVRAPRRPPDEQHAGPGDAGDEPVLRGRPAPARLARRLPTPLPGLGVAVRTSGRGTRRSARANAGWRSPAERLNRHRYHDHFLIGGQNISNGRINFSCFPLPSLFCP